MAMVAAAFPIAMAAIGVESTAMWIGWKRESEKEQKNTERGGEGFSSLDNPPEQPKATHYTMGINWDFTHRFRRIRTTTPR